MSSEKASSTKLQILITNTKILATINLSTSDSVGYKWTLIWFDIHQMYKSSPTSCSHNIVCECRIWSLKNPFFMFITSSKAVRIPKNDSDYLSVACSVFGPLKWSHIKLPVQTTWSIQQWRQKEHPDWKKILCLLELCVSSRRKDKNLVVRYIHRRKGSIWQNLISITNAIEVLHSCTWENSL